MNYHEQLKNNIHFYILSIYKLTSSFPREEIYGVVSQLRRATVSVMLNYIEGFARRKGNECKVYKNFLEISYGSLKESEYLVYLSHSLSYIDNEAYNKSREQADKIGGMLYGILSKLK